MLQIHKDVAMSMGMERSHIAIAENGSVIEITGKTMKINGAVPAGEVYVDAVSYTHLPGLIGISLPGRSFPGRSNK